MKGGDEQGKGKEKEKGRERQCRYAIIQHVCTCTT